MHDDTMCIPFGWKVVSPQPQTFLSTRPCSLSLPFFTGEVWIREITNEMRVHDYDWFFVHCTNCANRETEPIENTNQAYLTVLPHVVPCQLLI